jgi:hypothetical protein
MVHALKEIWRVLVPSGILLDFRPFGAVWPLEIVSDGQRQQVALVDRDPGIRDDAACEQALAQALREGWFVCERQETFTFSAFWDTPAEVTGPVTIPESVLAEAQALMDQRGQNAKISLHCNNVIARYRKQP